MTKKMVTGQVDFEFTGDPDEEQLDGVTIGELLAKLEVLKGEYGPDAKLIKDYYGHDGGFDLMIEYQRPETNSEYEARIKKEAQKKKREEAKLEKERKEYERLKKKFEG